MNAVVAAVWSELDIFTLKEKTKQQNWQWIIFLAQHCFTLLQIGFGFTVTNMICPLESAKHQRLPGPLACLTSPFHSFLCAHYKMDGLNQSQRLRKRYYLACQVGIKLLKLREKNTIGAILVKVMGRVLPCHCMLSMGTQEHFQHRKNILSWQQEHATCAQFDTFSSAFSHFFSFLNRVTFIWSFKWLAGV